jgi:branched-chain amino acid transport system ATP-binding protein
VKDFGGVRAVDRCSFNVGEGTITGLIGPNGAGKTTIFNLVTGFLKPSSGSIWFLDRRIDGLPPHQVFQQGILRTFQIPRELRRMTVLENLMLVPSGQLGEKVWVSWLRPRHVARQERALRQRSLEVLKFLNLHRLADEYAGNLSTGQKKLLELARTLMAQPRLVLLDEPGAGVNPSLMNVLVDDIRRANLERGVTFLIIEHNMDLIMKLCNPIVVMNNGATLAEGSPEEVKSNREVVEAYLGG